MKNFKELLECIKNGTKSSKINVARFFPNDKSLDLSNSLLNDEQGVQILELLIDNTTFKNVDFACNRLGKLSGPAIIRMLSKNKTLKHLHLYDNEIDNEASAGIAKALEKNTTLEGICLRFNSLGAKAVLAFAEMLSVNKTIESVGLSAVFFEDTISAIIKALKINNTLKRIYLDSDVDKRNDLGLAIVEILKVNKSLERIDLDGLDVGYKENFVNELKNETVLEIIKALEYNKTITVVSINLWGRTQDSIKVSIQKKKWALLDRNKEIQAIEKEINDLFSSEVLTSLKDKTSEFKKAKEVVEAEEAEETPEASTFSRCAAILDRIHQLRTSAVAQEFPHTKVFAQELQDNLMMLWRGDIQPFPFTMQCEALDFSMDSRGDSKREAEKSEASRSSSSKTITPAFEIEYMDCSSDPEAPSKKRKDNPTDLDKLEPDPRLLNTDSPSFENLYNLGFLYARQKHYRLAAHFFYYADKSSTETQNPAKIAIDKLIQQKKLKDLKVIQKSQLATLNEETMKCDVFSEILPTFHDMMYDTSENGPLCKLSLSIAESLSHALGKSFSDADRKNCFAQIQQDVEKQRKATREKILQYNSQHVAGPLQSIKRIAKDTLLKGQTSELEASLRTLQLKKERTSAEINSALLSDVVLEQFYSVSHRIINATTENDLILFLGRSPLLIAETCKAFMHFKRHFALIPFTRGGSLFGYCNDSPKKPEFEALKSFLTHTLSRFNIYEGSFKGSIILIDRIESGTSTIAFASIFSKFFPQLAPKLKIIGLAYDHEPEHQGIQFECPLLPLTLEAIRPLTAKKAELNFLALGLDFPHESWPIWEKLDLEPSLDACVIARREQIKQFVAEKERAAEIEKVVEKEKTVSLKLSP